MDVPGRGRRPARLRRIRVRVGRGPGARIRLISLPVEVEYARQGVLRYTDPGVSHANDCVAVWTKGTGQLSEGIRFEAACSLRRVENGALRTRSN